MYVDCQIEAFFTKFISAYSFYFPSCSLCSGLNFVPFFFISGYIPSDYQKKNTNASGDVLMVAQMNIHHWLPSRCTRLGKRTLKIILYFWCQILCNISVCWCFFTSLYSIGVFLSRHFFAHNQFHLIFEKKYPQNMHSSIQLNWSKKLLKVVKFLPHYLPRCSFTIELKMFVRKKSNRSLEAMKYITSNVQMQWVECFPITRS